MSGDLIGSPAARAEAERAAGPGPEEEGERREPWLVRGRLPDGSLHTVIVAAATRGQAEQSAADVVTELAGDERGQPYPYLTITSARKVGRFWLVFPLHLDERGELRGAEEEV